MTNDVERLQGRWRYETLEVDGRPAPADVLSVSAMSIDGQKFEMASLGVVYRGQFAVDERSTPRTLDIHFSDGPEKGKKSLGIYTLDGERWTICLGLAGRKRPREFKTTPGSGHALETLRRESTRAPAAAVPLEVPAAPKKRAQKSPVLDAESQSLQGEWAMVSCVRDGEKLPVEMVRTGKRVVDGDHTLVCFGATVLLEATFKVDATRTPRTIDHVLLSGPHAGQKQLGIYEVDRHVFRTSFAAPGAPRPTDFATRRGDGRTLSSWKRAKA